MFKIFGIVNKLFTYFLLSENKKLKLNINKENTQLSRKLVFRINKLII